RLIRRLNSELGLTAIVVSHDVVSVFRTADRILMMDAGQILTEGSPEAIQRCDHPQVQAFLQMASVQRL
ncbi:MAG: hypothetical protein NZL85_02765, partial [Fimbriimonadales bacterium]|nr:hypothetical protein [Fimbriimonadales bacterium]